jgi:hypothetical protein
VVPGLKKFDYGASALAGVRFNNGLFANLGYQLSLADISEGEGKYKNQGFQVSVGFFILKSLAVRLRGAAKLLPFYCLYFNNVVGSSQVD